MRMRKLIRAMLLGAFMLVAGVMMSDMDAAAKKQAYISSIALCNSESELESYINKGYTALTPGIKDGKWLVYATTKQRSTAITDLFIGSGSSRKIGDRKYTGYKAAPGGLLSKGALMYTKDSAAGEPLCALSLTTDDDGMAIRNDGSVYVGDADGGVVTLSANSKSYRLTMVKADAWKRYIGEIEVASAGSKKAAIDKLAGLGCEFYVDANYASDGYTMIGYSRTGDEDSAITNMILVKNEKAEIEGFDRIGDKKDKVRGAYLYVSTSPEDGNPLVYIDHMKNAGEESVTSLMCRDLIASYGVNSVSRAVIIDDPDYKAMGSENTEYLLMPILSSKNSDSGPVIMLDKTGLSDKNKQIRERIKAASEPTEEEAEPEGEPTKEQAAEENEEDTLADGSGGEAADEANMDVPSGDTGNVENVSQEQEGEAKAETDEGAATVMVGSAGIPLVAGIIFLVLLVAIPAATVIIRKKIQ